MAVTYFGHEQLTGDNTTMDVYSKYFLAGYTCPGSGTQNVVSLELGVAGVSAAANARMAIYTVAGAFVTQWETELQPGNSTHWEAVTSFVNQAGAPHSPTLTGGASYLLVVSCDSAGKISVYYTATSECARNGSEYTGGYPATINNVDVSSVEFAMRCGVEPAAAGGSIVPLAMHHYKMQRRGF